MVRLGIQRNGAGSVHGREILLDCKSGGAFLLDDGQRAVALRAEGFLRGGIEFGTVGGSGEREGGQDLAVFGAEDDHHGLCGLGRRIAGGSAGGEENVAFGIERQTIAAALVAEREVSGHFHGLRVNGGNAAGGILHDGVELTLAIANGFFGHAAEIDLAENLAIFRINNGGVFGGVAEDVDALVEVSIVENKIIT